MEFASPLIWWGDTSKTRLESYGGGPHEGLDFALAQTNCKQRLQAGLEGVTVSCLLEGRAHWRFDDLVGETLIVASEYSQDGKRFIVQYSHIDSENIAIGDELRQGTPIGKIKRSDNPKSITASHLHISTALIEERLLHAANGDISFNDWLRWDQSGDLRYLDPLSLVSPKTLQNHFLNGEYAKSVISRLVSTGACKEDRIRVRRALARNFPGVQCLNVKSLNDAKHLLDSKSILISYRDPSWTLEYIGTLTPPESKPLHGHSLSTLLETLSLIEQDNTKTV